MKMNLKLMMAAGLMATALNSLGQSSVVPTNVVNLGDRELLFGEPVELPWETSEAVPPNLAQPRRTWENPSTCPPVGKSRPRCPPMG